MLTNNQQLRFVQHLGDNAVNDISSTFFFWNWMVGCLCRLYYWVWNEDYYKHAIWTKMIDHCGCWHLNWSRELGGRISNEIGISYRKPFEISCNSGLGVDRCVILLRECCVEYLIAHVYWIWLLIFQHYNYEHIIVIASSILSFFCHNLTLGMNILECITSSLVIE